jgi:hypothetical protein
VSADLLTGDELDAIKTRAEAVDRRFTYADDARRVLDHDVPRLVAEVERLRAQVERVENFQKGLVVLGNLPIEKRPDGLTGGIEACAALANDLRVALDGP